MKLISEFKAQLAALGEIKRVWLTSFNINISFIETHLLPAVLGMDEPPKNRGEFERIQFELTRKNIDFRVYCDKRLITQEQHKRTSITILPVSVRQIAPELDAQESLFHPKVIYVEDIHGNMLLGAGSANLTLSGWGRNQEAVDFRRVSSNKQYQQIKSFFTRIDSSTEEHFPIRRKFFADDIDWEFIHTLSGRTLLKALTHNVAPKKLSVWSPYLAADLAGFIDSLSHAIGNEALSVDLVPDLAHGHFLRTPGGEEVDALCESDRLQLCHNPVGRDERAELTHAKIWLATGESAAKLAIGSWNFTAPGCASLKTSGAEQKHWNIEAGIVHSVSPKTKITGEPLKIGSFDFASQDLLADEALDLAPQLPFDLQVQFDWRSGKYAVSGEWFVGKSNAHYALRLPGIADDIPLRWRGSALISLGEVVAAQPDELLTRHFYTVLHPDEVDWQGIIHEVGQNYRRVSGFDTLHELLNSYIANSDPQQSDAVQLRESLHDGDSAEDEPQLAPLVESASTSYFRLFYALEKRREQLAALNDDATLHYWLFTCPGCLLELVEKVREHLAAQPASLFGWFMAHEVQSLCQLAKKRYRKKSLATHWWPKLALEVPPLPVKGKQRQLYLEAIKQRCGYEA